MFAASDGSGSVPNHASSISCASCGLVRRRLITRTFASFHFRAPAAVSASVHSAARTPVTLLAAIDAPVPVQQNSTPVSVAPVATDSPTRRTDLGPLLRFAGRRPDQHDLGPAVHEIVPYGVGQGGALVGSEHDSHPGEVTRRPRARMPCATTSRSRALAASSSLAPFLSVSSNVSIARGLGRGDRGRVHVHAGIGERDAQRVEEPGLVGGFDDTSGVPRRAVVVEREHGAWQRARGQLRTQ